MKENNYVTFTYSRKIIVIVLNNEVVHEAYHSYEEHFVENNR